MDYNYFDITKATENTKKKLSNQFALKNEKKKCSTIQNNSTLLPTISTIKTASPQINFIPYECNCKNLNEEIPLMCNSTSLFCIIKNYFIYLKSRNLFSYIDNESIQKLTQIQKYGTNQVQKIRISTNSSYSKLTILSSKNLTLVLKSPRAVGNLAKITDTICCKEFLNFVSKHCYCDMDEKLIKNADNVMAQLIKTKNRY